MVVVVLFSLKFVTKHGEGVTVPNVTGLYVEEAEILFKQQELTYEVIDSVYVRNKLQGEIFVENKEFEYNFAATSSKCFFSSGSRHIRSYWLCSGRY